MSTAYILLNSKPNSENEIISEIKEIMGYNPSIKYEINGVYGVYDLIVKIDGERMKDIQDILGKIRKINRIVSTITMPLTEGKRT